MTRIKLCGLTRSADIEAANLLKPDYIGFVFAAKSRRWVSPEQAAELKAKLDPDIRTVGVFVDQEPEQVADLFRGGVIDFAQLHGHETAGYIRRLRGLCRVQIIQAFRIGEKADVTAAKASAAEYVLLDSGSGSGAAFDWDLIGRLDRPYFLAGGLDADSVGPAVRSLAPFAVDVSSGIESGGLKDKEKMAAFVAAVRKADGI